MDIMLNRTAITFYLAFILVDVSSAQTQDVTAIFSPSSITDGQTTDLALSYSAANNALLSGIGLRVHFNSSHLSVEEPSHLLSPSMQAHQLKDDQADYDNDLSTDKYYLMAWADLSVDGWPLETNFPASLAVLPFTALDGFNGSSINFTSSALAYGYDLVAEPVSITRALFVDTDLDGLPDDYETDNGFDPADPLDAEGDLDGDGISNLDEFLAGSDPARDEQAPQLFIPDDLTVAATGYLTAVDFGDAEALDDTDGVLIPKHNSEGLLESGRHEILWSVTDLAGNSSSQIQIVNILPIANLTHSTIVPEGSSHDVTVILSGAAPEYPVTVPIMVEGTVASDDFNLPSYEVTIEEGTLGAVALTITLDADIESEEQLVIRLGAPANAVLGMVSTRTLTIVEENIPPELELVVTQDGRQGRLVTADGGLVRVNATYADPNPGDSHDFEWLADTLDTVGVTAEGATLTLDPSVLLSEMTSIAATVSDNGNPILTATGRTLIRLLDSAPALHGATDTDGDGLADADEGFGDADGDGIPDYQDNLDQTHQVPADPGLELLAESAVGSAIALGDFVFALSYNSIFISQEQLNKLISQYDDQYEYPAGLFDFKLTGAQAGESYNLVLPLISRIPEGAIVRTFLGDNIGWQDFSLDASNAISSAIAVDGACPAPGSDLYKDGLVLGANCLQLLIQDGGSNDADGLVDGTVTNVSGVAVPIITEPVAPTQSIEVTFHSGGGCTVATGSSRDGSLMLLIALGLVRLMRDRFKLVQD
jgi:hypothetical protein